jgi:hypothetical protein
MRVDPAYYRAKAAQTRKLANKARDADTKAYLLKVAAEYEKLAVDVEQRGD